MYCILNGKFMRAVVLLGVIECVGIVAETQAKNHTQRVRAGHDPAYCAPDVFEIPAAWEYSAPLIAPEKRDHEPSRAQKDPTLVLYEESLGSELD